MSGNLSAKNASSLSLSHLIILHTNQHGPWLWNKFKSVNRSINFSLTTIKIKNILKYSLLEAQNTYGDNWCEYNFTKFAKLIKIKLQTMFLLTYIHRTVFTYEIPTLLI